MRLTQCRVDGCYAICTPPETHCPRHQGIKAAQVARQSATNSSQWSKFHAANPEMAAIWKSGRWRKMRAAHLKANPLCACCPSPATTVHHVRPHRGDPAIAFDAANLVALCKPCHDRASRAQSRQ